MNKKIMNWTRIIVSIIVVILAFVQLISDYVTGYVFVPLMGLNFIIGYFADKDDKLRYPKVELIAGIIILILAVFTYGKLLTRL